MANSPSRRRSLRAGRSSSLRRGVDLSFTAPAPTHRYPDQGPCGWLSRSWRGSGSAAYICVRLRPTRVMARDKRHLTRERPGPSVRRRLGGPTQPHSQTSPAPSSRGAAPPIIPATTRWTRPKAAVRLNSSPTSLSRGKSASKAVAKPTSSPAGNFFNSLLEPEGAVERASARSVSFALAVRRDARGRRRRVCINARGRSN